MDLSVVPYTLLLSVRGGSSHSENCEAVEAVESLRTLPPSAWALHPATKTDRALCPCVPLQTTPQRRWSSTRRWSCAATWTPPPRCCPPSPRRVGALLVPAACRCCLPACRLPLLPLASWHARSARAACLPTGTPPHACSYVPVRRTSTTPLPSSWRPRACPSWPWRWPPMQVRAAAACCRCSELALALQAGAAPSRRLPPTSPPAHFLSSSLPPPTSCRLPL